MDAATAPAERLARLFSTLRGGAAWGGVALVGAGCGAILVGAVLARLVTVEEVGAYFLFAQLVRLGSLVHSFGLQRGLLKVVGIATDAGDAAERRRAAGLALGMLALTTLAASALATLAWPALDRATFQGLLGPGAAAIAVAAIALRSCEEVAAALLRGAGRLRAGVLLLGAPRELVLLALLALAWAAGLRPTLHHVVIAYALTSLGVVLLVAPMVAGTLRGAARPPRVPAKVEAVEAPRRLTLGKLAALCFPMMVFGAASQVYNSAALWALGLTGNLAAVAAYGAAARLVLVLGVLLKGINLVLPPSVAALYASGRHAELTALLRATATWSLLCSAAVLAVYGAFGAEILAMAYGPTYAASAGVLLVLAAGEAFNAACGSPGVLLQMSGHHGLMARLTVVTAALATAGCLAVVAAHGALGVAAVTAASLVAQNLATTFLAWRLTGLVTLPGFRLTPRMAAGA